MFFVSGKKEDIDVWLLKGLAYVEGNGVSRDIDKAAFFFEKILKSGYSVNAGIYYMLGMAYLEGDGVPRDITKARYWLEKAVKWGDDRAVKVMAEVEAKAKAEAEAEAIVKAKAEAEEEVLAATGMTDVKDYNGYAMAYMLANNFDQAVFWYNKAAAQGSAEAQRSLALVYANGLGVVENEKTAAEWWRKAGENGPISFEQAAGRGDFLGQYFLAMAYEGGSGDDFERAAYWWLKLAEKNILIAQYKLGMIYAKGIGVVKDMEKALYWWKKAAERGDFHAQKALGLAYAAGESAFQDFEEVKVKDAEKDMERAAYLWKTEGKEKFDIQKILKFLYSTGEDVFQDSEAVKKALYWWEKAAVHPADRGETANALGNAYFEGLGVIKQNFIKAAQWYSRSAEKGNAEGQYNLGRTYAEGKGVPQDWETAELWYRKSADQGNFDAQRALLNLPLKA